MKKLALLLLISLPLFAAPAKPPYVPTPVAACDAGEVLTWLSPTGVSTCVAVSDLEAAPCGSDTYVQFNDSGACGASAGFTWGNGDNLLSLTDIAASLSIGGAGVAGSPTIWLQGQIDTAATSGIAVFGAQTIPSSLSQRYTTFSSAPNLTESDTLNDILHFNAAPATNVSGLATIVDEVAYNAEDFNNSLATNGIGFRSNVTASATTWGYNNAGGARDKMSAQGIVLTPRTGVPSTLEDGMLWFDNTGNDHFGVRANGTTTQLQLGPLTGDVETVGTAATIPAGTVAVAQLAATGTPDSSTYLRGDDTWAEISGVGSPLGNDGEIYVHAGGDNAALGAPLPGQRLMASGTADKLRWEHEYESRYREIFTEDFTGPTATSVTNGVRTVNSVATGGSVGPWTNFVGYGPVYAMLTNTGTSNAYAAIGVQPNAVLITRNNATALNLWRASFVMVTPVGAGQFASDVSNRYKLFVGLANQIAANPTTGVYIDCVDNVNSGNWVIRTINASTPGTPTNTSVSCANATPNYFDFELSGTTMTVYGDGASMGTISVSNISGSTTLIPVASITKSTGFANYLFYWKRFTYVQERTTPSY